MGFFVVKGTFHVKGYSPDGDSVRFKASTRSNWDLLDGPSQLAINSQGHVQLRVEGIDALESHFGVSGGNVHQPLNFADGATDFLLAQTGITGVVWNSNKTRIVQANDGIPGYILTRQKDKFGRPVAFVFAGTTTHADGTNVYLDVDELKGSINYKSLEAGHAFATFYTGLFADLRGAMAAAVAAARTNGIGIFAADKTYSGVTINSLDTITDQHVIMPKLFRRLASFITSDPSPNLSGFKGWLEKRNELVLILRTLNFTHLDNLIEVNGQEVKLTELPEDLVFIA